MNQYITSLRVFAVNFVKILFYLRILFRDKYIIYWSIIITSEQSAIILS